MLTLLKSIKIYIANYVYVYIDTFDVFTEYAVCAHFAIQANKTADVIREREAGASNPGELDPVFPARIDFHCTRPSLTYIRPASPYGKQNRLKPVQPATRRPKILFILLLFCYSF